VLCSVFLLLSANGATPARSAVTESNRSEAQGTIRKSLKWTVIGGAEYVSASDVAADLGMKSIWLEPGRKLVLAGGADTVQVERDRIEAVVNGLGVRLGNAPVFREGNLYVSQIDLECSLFPRIRPALVGVPPARPKIIALDAGHGGKDNGMQNTNLGLKEKTLTLDVVKRLKTLCVAAGFKVVLTRTGDNAPINEDLPLRAKVVNAAHSDLLVSVHFNSLYPDTKTSGTESYVYTPRFQRSTGALSLGAGTDDARREAVRVNRWDPWSALLADHIQREVLTRLKTVDRGQKTGHLLVLQDVNCPAVLVESGFLSNDAEGRRAASPEFRQEIAAAIFSGILKYIAALDELSTEQRRHGEDPEFFHR